MAAQDDLYVSLVCHAPSDHRAAQNARISRSEQPARRSNSRLCDVRLSRPGARAAPRVLRQVATPLAGRVTASNKPRHPIDRPRARVPSPVPTGSAASKQIAPRPRACPCPRRARVILLCFRSPCKSLRFPFPSPSRKRPPRPSRVAYVAPLCNLPRTARARASLGHTPRASPYKNGGAPRVAGQLTL